MKKSRENKRIWLKKWLKIVKNLSVINCLEKIQWEIGLVLIIFLPQALIVFADIDHCKENWETRKSQEEAQISTNRNKKATGIVN
jgi:hypothetical protein